MNKIISYNGKSYKAIKIGKGKFSSIYSFKVGNTSIVAKTISKSPNKEIEIHNLLSSKKTSKVYVPKFLGADKEYIFMKQVVGLHTHEFVVNKSNEEILKLAIGMAIAYKAVNNIGVLHRDINSMNIIVESSCVDNEYPKVSIIDFGLSIIGDPSANKWQGKFKNHDGWAQERTAPPEAHNINTNITTSYETFALTSMIWRLFDEEYPFGAFKRGIPLRKQRVNRRKVPNRIKDYKELIEFFDKGLSLNIENRFKTASEIITKLVSILKIIKKEQTPLIPKKEKQAFKKKIKFISSPNFVEKENRDIDKIIIHITQLDFNSTIQYFKLKRSEVSSHFVISNIGKVIQMVDIKNIAWHAKPWNTRSIGIEHEGYFKYKGKTTNFTDAQYKASAKIVKELALKYDIPLDREHIIGHREVPGVTKNCPGGNWDWDYYMVLLRGLF